MTTAGTSAESLFGEIAKLQNQSPLQQQQDIVNDLETNYSVPSFLAGPISAAIVSGGTATWDSIGRPPSLDSLFSGLSFTLPTLPRALNSISVAITSCTVDMGASGDNSLTITGTCTGVLPNDPSPLPSFFLKVINDNGDWKLVFGGELGSGFQNLPVIGSDLANS